MRQENIIKATHLAHNIRNPVTAIGDTARLLTRKISEQQLNFLGMMLKEVGKIEQTLEDLLGFVDQVPATKDQVQLYPLVEKSLMLFQNIMHEKEIEHEVINNR